jgi:hypothetical protein
VSFNLLAEVYDWAGLFVKDYVLTNYGPSTSVLDVGAGRGKYRMLLPTYASVDACEVWEPTVDREGLRDLYRDVFVCDVVELVQLPSWDESRYDLVIMGDVLEHMTVDDARLVLRRTLEAGADVIVVVPYSYPQDEEDGNEYQRHLQDQLTPELMSSTYPTLELIALETRDFKPFKGIYVGRA